MASKELLQPSYKLLRIPIDELSAKLLQQTCQTLRVGTNQLNSNDPNHNTSHHNTIVFMQALRIPVELCLTSNIKVRPPFRSVWYCLCMHEHVSANPSVEVQAFDLNVLRYWRAMLIHANVADCSPPSQGPSRLKLSCVCMYVSVRLSVSKCVYLCVFVCVLACVCVCVRACMRGM